MLNRKKFFTLIGKSTLLISLFSFLPFKFLQNIRRNSSSSIKVKIHPSAIKRNN